MFLKRQELTKLFKYFDTENYGRINYQGVHSTALQLASDRRPV